MASLSAAWPLPLGAVLFGRCQAHTLAHRCTHAAASLIKLI